MFLRLWGAVLPCLTLLAFCDSVQAQDTPVSQPSTKVLPAFIEQKVELQQSAATPLRRNASLREATRPAYVITREELDQQGSQTVDEALKYLPGIRVEGTAGGQVGALSSQIARGGSSAQVLILVDGRPINEIGGSGGFDLSQFTTDSLERIEVVPGGASTLYGADAVGGVINLITRRPTNKDQLTFKADVGSFGLNSQSVRYSGRRGDVNWSLGYQRLGSQNNFPYTVNTPTTFQGLDAQFNPVFGTTATSYSGFRQNAAVLTNNLDGKITWQIDERNRLAFNVLVLDKTLNVPGGIPITQPGSDGFNPNNGLPNFGSFGGFNSLSPFDRQYTGTVLTQLLWDRDLGEGEDSKLTVRVYGDFSKFRSVSFDNAANFSNRFDYPDPDAQLRHRLPQRPSPEREPFCWRSSGLSQLRRFL
jgi:vitamin B12 transporter